jgi:hypothetical protein
MDKATTENYVYILHAQGTNRFKIGHSQDPIKRQNAINNALSPFPIKLIACYLLPDAHNEEQRLHREFKDRRVYGEWFEFDSVDQVKELTSKELGVVETRISGVYLDGQIARLPFVLVDSLDDKQNNVDKIGITKVILKEVFEWAVSELESPNKFSSHYKYKIPAIQLLTGKYVSEIIYNTFQQSPLLSVDCKGITGKLPDLVNSQLESIRTKTSELSLREQRKLDPLNPTFEWWGTSLHKVDNILAPVRKRSERMPSLIFYPNRKTQHIRGIYAFSCWVFLDNCQSNEDDYINSLLA